MRNFLCSVFLMISLSSFTQNYGEWNLVEEISDGKEIYRSGLLETNFTSLIITEYYDDISFVLKDKILSDDNLKVIFDFEFDLGSCIFITYGVPSVDREYLFFTNELTKEKYFNYLKISKRLKITIIYDENTNKRYIFNIDGISNICDYVLKKL